MAHARGQAFVASADVSLLLKEPHFDVNLLQRAGVAVSGSCLEIARQQPEHDQVTSFRCLLFEDCVLICLPQAQQGLGTRPHVLLRLPFANTALRVSIDPPSDGASVAKLHVCVRRAQSHHDGASWALALEAPVLGEGDDGERTFDAQLWQRTVNPPQQQAAVLSGETYTAALLEDAGAADGASSSPGAIVEYTTSLAPAPAATEPQPSAVPYASLDALGPPDILATELGALRSLLTSGSALGLPSPPHGHVIIKGVLERQLLGCLGPGAALAKRYCALRIAPVTFDHSPSGSGRMIGCAEEAGNPSLTLSFSAAAPSIVASQWDAFDSPPAFAVEGGGSLLLRPREGIAAFFSPAETTSIVKAQLELYHDAKAFSSGQPPSHVLPLSLVKGMTAAASSLAAAAATSYSASITSDAPRKIELWLSHGPSPQALCVRASSASEAARWARTIGCVLHLRQVLTSEAVAAAREIVQRQQAAAAEVERQQRLEPELVAQSQQASASRDTPTTDETATASAGGIDGVIDALVSPTAASRLTAGGHISPASTITGGDVSGDHTLRVRHATTVVAGRSPSTDTLAAAAAAAAGDGGGSSRRRLAFSPTGAMSNVQVEATGSGSEHSNSGSIGEAVAALTAHDQQEEGEDGSALSHEVAAFRARISAGIADCAAQLAAVRRNLFLLPLLPPSPSSSASAPSSSTLSSLPPSARLHASVATTADEDGAVAMLQAVTALSQQAAAESSQSGCELGQDNDEALNALHSSTLSVCEVVMASLAAGGLGHHALAFLRRLEGACPALPSFFYVTAIVAFGRGGDPSTALSLATNFLEQHYYTHKSSSGDSDANSSALREFASSVAMASIQALSHSGLLPQVHWAVRAMIESQSPATSGLLPALNHSLVTAAAAAGGWAAAEEALLAILEADTGAATSPPPPLLPCSLSLLLRTHLAHSRPSHVLCLALPLLDGLTVAWDCADVSWKATQEGRVLLRAVEGWQGHAEAVMAAQPPSHNCRRIAALLMSANKRSSRPRSLSNSAAAISPPPFVAGSGTFSALVAAHAAVVTSSQLVDDALAGTEAAFALLLAACDVSDALHVTAPPSRGERCAVAMAVEEEGLTSGTSSHQLLDICMTPSACAALVQAHDVSGTPVAGNLPLINRLLRVGGGTLSEPVLAALSRAYASSGDVWEGDAIVSDTLAAAVGSRDADVLEKRPDVLLRWCAGLLAPLVSSASASASPVRRDWFRLAHSSARLLPREPGCGSASTPLCMWQAALARCAVGGSNNSNGYDVSGMGDALLSLRSEGLYPSADCYLSVLGDVSNTGVRPSLLADLVSSLVTSETAQLPGTAGGLRTVVAAASGEGAGPLPVSYQWQRGQIGALVALAMTAAGRLTEAKRTLAVIDAGGVEPAADVCAKGDAVVTSPLVFPPSGLLASVYTSLALALTHAISFDVSSASGQGHDVDSLCTAAEASVGLSRIDGGEEAGGQGDATKLSHLLSLYRSLLSCHSLHGRIGPARVCYSAIRRLHGHSENPPESPAAAAASASAGSSSALPRSSNNSGPLPSWLLEAAFGRGAASRHLFSSLRPLEGYDVIASTPPVPPHPRSIDGLPQLKAQAEPRYAVGSDDCAAAPAGAYVIASVVNPACDPYLLMLTALCNGRGSSSKGNSGSSSSLTQAMAVLSHMTSDGVAPDSRTVTSLLQVAALSGQGDQGWGVVATTAAALASVGASAQQVRDVMTSALVFCALCATFACEGRSDWVTSAFNTWLGRQREVEAVAGGHTTIGLVSPVWYPPSKSYTACVNTYVTCLALATLTSGCGGSGGQSATGSQLAGAAASNSLVLPGPDPEDHPPSPRQALHLASSAIARHLCGVTSTMGPGQTSDVNVATLVAGPAGRCLTSNALVAIALLQGACGARIASRRLLTLALQHCQLTPQSLTSLLLPLMAGGLTGDVKALLASAASAAASPLPLGQLSTSGTERRFGCTLAIPWLAAVACRNDSAGVAAVWQQLTSLAKAGSFQQSGITSSAAALPSIAAGGVDDVSSLPLSSLAHALGSRHLNPPAPCSGLDGSQHMAEDGDDIAASLTALDRLQALSSASLILSSSAAAHTGAASIHSASVSPSAAASNIRVAYLVGSGQLQAAVDALLDGSGQLMAFKPLSETLSLVLQALAVNAGMQSTTSSSSPQLARLPPGITPPLPVGPPATAPHHPHTLIALHLLHAAASAGMAPRPIDRAALVQLHASSGNLSLAYADVTALPCPLTYGGLLRGLYGWRDVSVDHAELAARRMAEDGVAADVSVAAAVEALSQRLFTDLRLSFKTQGFPTASVTDQSALSPSNLPSSPSSALTVVYGRWWALQKYSRLFASPSDDIDLPLPQTVAAALVSTVLAAVEEGEAAIGSSSSWGSVGAYTLAAQRLAGDVSSSSSSSPAAERLAAELAGESQGASSSSHRKAAAATGPVDYVARSQRYARWSPAAARPQDEDQPAHLALEDGPSQATATAADGVPRSLNFGDYTTSTTAAASQQPQRSVISHGLAGFAEYQRTASSASAASPDGLNSGSDSGLPPPLPRPALPPPRHPPTVDALLAKSDMAYDVTAGGDVSGDAFAYGTGGGDQQQYVPVFADLTERGDKEGSSHPLDPAIDFLLGRQPLAAAAGGAGADATLGARLEAAALSLASLPPIADPLPPYNPDVTTSSSAMSAPTRLLEEAVSSSYAEACDLEAQLLAVTSELLAAESQLNACLTASREGKRRAVAAVVSSSSRSGGTGTTLAGYLPAPALVTSLRSALTSLHHEESALASQLAAIPSAKGLYATYASAVRELAATEEGLTSRLQEDDARATGVEDGLQEAEVARDRAHRQQLQHQQGRGLALTSSSRNTSTSFAEQRLRSLLPQLSSGRLSHAVRRLRKARTSALALLDSQTACAATTAALARHAAESRAAGLEAAQASVADGEARLSAATAELVSLMSEERRLGDVIAGLQQAAIDQQRQTDAAKARLAEAAALARGVFNEEVQRVLTQREVNYERALRQAEERGLEAGRADGEAAVAAERGHWDGLLAQHRAAIVSGLEGEAVKTITSHLQSKHRLEERLEKEGVIASSVAGRLRESQAVLAAEEKVLATLQEAVERARREAASATSLQNTVASPDSTADASTFVGTAVNSSSASVFFELLAHMSPLLEATDVTRLFDGILDACLPPPPSIVGSASTAAPVLSGDSRTGSSGSDSGGSWCDPLLLLAQEASLSAYEYEFARLKCLLMPAEASASSAVSVAASTPSSPRLPVAARAPVANAVSSTAAVGGDDSDDDPFGGALSRLDALLDRSGAHGSPEKPTAAANRSSSSGSGKSISASVGLGSPSSSSHPRLVLAVGGTKATPTATKGGHHHQPASASASAPSSNGNVVIAPRYLSGTVASKLRLSESMTERQVAAAINY